MFSFWRKSTGSGSTKCLRLLCSCDLHNYGDLLFPIVTRWAMMRVPGFRKQYSCAQYGLQRSDLSAFGAQPSLGIRDLYQDTKQGDVVLLAGGENLAQTWRVMNRTLLDAEEAGKLSLCNPECAEKQSRERFRARHEFPYILSPDLFGPGVRVMYNSMGGWPLRHYSPESQQAIVGDLAKASFISMREDESASIVRELDDGIPLYVAPDCVFLMSDMHPRKSLSRKVSPDVRSLVRRSGKYVAFQCHCRYGDANREELKRQLIALVDRTGLTIVLTPIGRMGSFEDDVFLKSLHAEMEGRAHLLPASAGIYDVAYVLAAAHLFCGTSLHGVITALAYEVPFVPLSSEDPKLGHNIKSWGLNEVFPLVPTAGIADVGMRSAAMERWVVKEHAMRLRTAAGENMKRLGQAILDS